MRDLDDRAAGRRLRRSRDGRVLVQREVRSPLVIVDDVLQEVTAQRALVPHDDVVEALASQGENLRLELETCPNGAAEGGEQCDEQRGHAAADSISLGPQLPRAQQLPNA